MGTNSTKRIVTVVAATAAFGLFAGTGNAVAAKLIDSGDVKNNSLQSVDVRNGSLKSIDVQDGTLSLKDMNSTINNRIRGGATLAQLQALAVALDDRLSKLEAEDATGANTNFVAATGSTIVDDTTVALAQTTGGTSVEIANLDVPVQAGQTVSFTYELAGGAVYGAGAPRVFYEIAGTFYNTFDGNPSDAGTDNEDGTFTKSVTVPTNGRVGALGVVNDSGTPGTITVSDVTVGTYTVKFQ